MNNPTIRAPRNDGRAAFIKFIALVAFAMTAALSINCHLGLFECPTATGTGGVRSDAAPINKLAAVINPPQPHAAYIVRGFLMENEL